MKFCGPSSFAISCLCLLPFVRPCGVLLFIWSMRSTAHVLPAAQAVGNPHCKKGKATIQAPSGISFFQYICITEICLYGLHGLRAMLRVSQKTRRCLQRKYERHLVAESEHPCIPPHSDTQTHTLFSAPSGTRESGKGRGHAFACKRLAVPI